MRIRILTQQLQRLTAPHLPTMYLMLMVTLMTSTVIKCWTNQSGLGCEFPLDWRGRYFQSGLGVVTVSQKAITTKGLCIESTRDYFLFDNRENSCYQCLLLLRQHKNILQYKESYCTSSASELKTVCNEIRVELPLYTLIREPAIPVPCPFQDVYRFDFSDLTDGFCGRASSLARPCTMPSRIHLQFSDCVKGPRFHDKDIELECLAVWKDGSETYLYSRLTGTGLVSKDDRYRCFTYQMYGSDVSMAMTADATCRGLRSPVDGPFLLEMHRDESVLSQSNCRFPDWMKGGVTWKSLGGRFRYRLEKEGTALYRSEEHGPRQRSFTIFRCQSQEKSDSTDDEMIIVSSSTMNCSYYVQCLKLERIAHQVIKISEGTELNPEVHSTCRTWNVGVRTDILVPGDHRSSACPSPGVHHTTPSGGCIHRLTIGCQDEAAISIDHSCSPGQPGLLFECFASWTEGNKLFVILKKSKTDSLQCFSFTQEGSLTIFSSDENCNRNWSLQSPPVNLSYSIMRRETCKRNVKMTEATVKQTTTTHDATTKPTTNFVNYYHMEDEKFSDDDDDNYDFEFQTPIEEKTGRRQLSNNYDDDNNDKGVVVIDDDGDVDDEDAGDSSPELSGEGGVTAGGVGGRRNVFEWYVEPVFSTPGRKELSTGGIVRTTVTRQSVLRITGKSFIRGTPYPSSYPSPPFPSRTKTPLDRSHENHHDSKSKERHSGLNPKGIGDDSNAIKNLATWSIVTGSRQFTIRLCLTFSICLSSTIISLH